MALGGKVTESICACSALVCVLLVSLIDLDSPCSHPLTVPVLALVLLRGNVHDTASCGCSLGFAPQLVPVALDVVQPVGDDNGFLGQGSFDGRELLRTRRLLSRGAVVNFISEGGFLVGLILRGPVLAGRGWVILWI